MKIDLNTIDRENFMVHPHKIGEHECFLVQPVHIGAKWTRETMIFRSSIWSADGELVSASYPKFFNWGEHPELTPPPSSLDNAFLMDKIDGSTLILSRWKGHTIARTRGTVDASAIDNGYEIEYLLQKYPRVVDFIEGAYTTEGEAETMQCSLIFEWTTPTNVIVLKYGDDPELVLTGMIFHKDYSLASQDMLDDIAKKLDVSRPRTYSFNSVEQMKVSVEKLRGKEGLCVYFNDGQSILKVKSAEYLYLHRAKSEVSSIEKVMDVYLNLWVTEGKFYSYQEFFEHLERIFDYEIANIARGHISNICDAMKEVNTIIESMTSFVEPLRTKSRKEAALSIQQAYGTTSRCGYVFKMLDNKPLDADAYKKLIFQCLKG